MAEGGTLFLDEIGDLDPAAQVKLLRVLQERQYERLGDSRVRKTDVRILSATSRDLRSMVTAGTFREDLLYRINLIHLHLPPLRERPDDILPLAEHFLTGARKRYDRPDLKLGNPAANWLRRQPFPGNIRQLQNLMERTAILAPATVIQVDDFRQGLRPRRHDAGGNGNSDDQVGSGAQRRGDCGYCAGARVDAGGALSQVGEVWD